MKLFSRVKLECCAVSHVGRVRGNNEDNFILTDRWNETSGDYKMDARRMAVSRGKWLVLGVFDGMGGGEMGEAASRAASMRFLTLQRMLKRCPPERLSSLVRRAFQDANNDIVALQEQAAVFGTTATVLCTNGEAFRIWHQGDSRAYLLRGGILRQLTEDQTLAQMKIRVGLCRADDPKLEPDRHKLTDYVGKDWTKEISVRQRATGCSCSGATGCCCAATGCMIWCRRRPLPPDWRTAPWRRRQLPHWWRQPSAAAAETMSPA